MFYTALGHTEATYADANFLKHLLGGLDTAAGVVVDADCGVDEVAHEVTVDTTVGADVPLVLGLTLGGPAQIGALTPGVAAEYTASISAVVTSTAGNAALTVADPDPTSPGRLINGTYALEQPLQVRASNAETPNPAFAPVGTSPLALLSWPRSISSDAVAVGFKQAVGANETLRAGNYGKTLTFTLSTTTP
jgi:hypothetical protein